MAQTYILIIQARVLLLVGLGWLITGLLLDYDPLMVAWRAAAAGLLAMVATGALLRLGLRSVSRAILAAEARNAEAEARAAAAAAEREGRAS